MGVMELMGFVRREEVEEEKDLIRDGTREKVVGEV